MTGPATYICRCGKIYNGLPNMTPPGWHWHNGTLMCDDCRLSGSRLAINDSMKASAAVTGPNCPTAIRLLSGNYIDLMDPDCTMVQPCDIAAGLRQGRYSGQTRHFFTIAQHSLLVLQLVDPIAKSLGGEKGLQLRRCALMHDAVEAFIHDLTAPLKSQLPKYRGIEARFEIRLAKRFGWKWTDFRRISVKRADIQALAIEQRDLIGIRDPWPRLANIDYSKLPDIHIARAWHVDEAEERFLNIFEELFPKSAAVS